MNSVSAVPLCACGCGRQARVNKYNADCANECACGCGGRARYAYKIGHRPERPCVRCGKIFSPRPDTDDPSRCSQCRRHIKNGAPVEKDTSLIYKRKMRKASPEGRSWCCGCEDYRLLKFFSVEKSSGRVNSRCKPCAKSYQRALFWKKKFGITADQYEEVKDAQGGKCAICQVATGASKSLSVDHDHKCCPNGSGCSNCIRGLLCSNCNTMLGMARDNPEFFMRAVEYLERPPAREILTSCDSEGHVLETEMAGAT